MLAVPCEDIYVDLVYSTRGKVSASTLQAINVS